MMLKLKSAHAANYGLCCVVPHFHVCPNRVALAHHGLARGANCSRQIDRAICSRRSVNVQCKASSQPYAVGTVVRPPGAQNEIRWGSYVSTKEDLPDAIEEAVDRIMGSIGNDSQPELAIVFVSSTHGPDYSTVVPLLRKRLPSLKHVFGCSGYGVMGGRSEGPVEVEGEPGFSLTLGQIPGADIRVLHTLRASLPGKRATPDNWAEFVRLPKETARPVSFVMFADQSFGQVRDLVAGLDYAFPDAPKIGAIMSAGTRSRSRAMFAWSADGVGGPSGLGDQRRRLSSRFQSGSSSSSSAAAAGASSASSASSTDLPPEIEVVTAPDGSSGAAALGSSGSSSGRGEASPAATSGGSSGGLLGGLMNTIRTKLQKADERSGEAAVTPSPSPVLSTSDSSSSLRRLKGSRGAGSSSMDSEETDSGVHLYGAVVLALHGEVQLDTITSMGYRAPTNRIWRVASVSEPGVVVSVIPEEVFESKAGEGGPGGSGPSGLARGRTGGRGLRDDDSDDDSDDEETGMSSGEGEGPEMQAVVAVVELMEAAMGDAGMTDREWEELMSSAVVAIATDGSKKASELGPDDWTIYPLEEIMDEYGVLVLGEPPEVGARCEVRPGDRLRVLVRDAEGSRQDLREVLLAAKRRDLGAMVTGAPIPPMFGVLLLSDVDRGIGAYEQDNWESRTVHSYLPVPLSGVFAGAQIAPLATGFRTGVLENTAVLGVLRAATEKSSASLRRAAAARAAAVTAASEALRKETERARNSAMGGRRGLGGSKGAKGRVAGEEEEEDEE